MMSHAPPRSPGTCPVPPPTRHPQDALNLLFLAVPLLNVALPFVYKSFPFIFSADCLLMAVRAGRWRGVGKGGNVLSCVPVRQ